MDRPAFLVPLLDYVDSISTVYMLLSTSVATPPYVSIYLFNCSNLGLTRDHQEPDAGSNQSLFMQVAERKSNPAAEALEPSDAQHLQA